MSAWDDSKLLMSWAKLQLAIVIANHPEQARLYPLLPGQPDHGSEDRITKTVGFKKLRNWFKTLSPQARTRARRWMAHWITGTAAVIAKAEASGDYSGLRGITIDFVDTSGASLPTINLQPAQEHDDGESSDSSERTEDTQAAHPEGGADDAGSGGTDR